MTRKLHRNLQARGQAGFTMVELIIVIVVIAILSVFLLPSMPASTLNLQYSAAQVLNDIRYAQALSMATGQRYRLVQVSSNSYSITDQSGNAIIMPSGGTVMLFSNGITFSAFTNLPNNLVAFNSQGIPYTDTSIPGTALASTATITLTAAGATRSMTISPQTGFGALQ